jgi:outer membrane protein OmpA-like peptidoglycan-associated protein
VRIARKAIPVALTFASLCACAAKGPPITAPIGIDDPNRPVSAPNPKLETKPESEIAIEVRAEEIERCQSAALTSPHFDFNSAAVRPEDNPALRALAECVVSGPLRGAYLTLVGHADATGDERYDAMLARARAEEVSRFLMARGVAESALRIRATVDAPTPTNEPAFPGDDMRGWAKRRVDIVVKR